MCGSKRDSKNSGLVGSKQAFYLLSAGRFLPHGWQVLAPGNKENMGTRCHFWSQFWILVLVQAFYMLYNELVSLQYNTLLQISQTDLEVSLTNNSSTMTWPSNSNPHDALWMMITG